MMFKNSSFVFCSFLNAVILGSHWVVPQPKQNIFVMLANITKQDMMCLSIASPGNPFSTCLVGLPMDMLPIAEDAIHTLQKNSPKTTKKYNPVDAWDYWTWKLPHALQELQELELLGSTKMDFLKFYFMKDTKPIRKEMKPKNLTNR